MGYYHLKFNFIQNSIYFFLQNWSLINILVSVSDNITTLKNVSLSTYKHEHQSTSTRLPPHASIQVDLLLTVPVNWSLTSLCLWDFVFISQEIMIFERLSDLFEAVSHEVRPRMWDPSDYALNHRAVPLISLPQSLCVALTVTYPVYQGVHSSSEK